MDGFIRLWEFAAQQGMLESLLFVMLLLPVGVAGVFLVLRKLNLVTFGRNGDKKVGRQNNGDLRERLGRIEEAVEGNARRTRELIQWHSVKDEDQIPFGYFTPSMKKTLTTMCELQKDVLRELKSISTRLNT